MRRIALALATMIQFVLCTLVPGGSVAQPIHPVNMVSGVDSIDVDGISRSKMIYAVPTGQTLVLTDITTSPHEAVATLYDDLGIRYVLPGVATGSPFAKDRGAISVSLTTGIVFQSGSQVILSFGAVGTAGRVWISWSGYLVPQVVGIAPSETHRRLGFALTPNPSDQVVELRFELSKPADVSLRIYDVQGRLVTTLADARMPRGIHDFSWTGKTQQGATAASGVYFARLESSESKSVKRLIRIR